MTPHDLAAEFTQLNGVMPLGDPAGQKLVFRCVLPGGAPGVLKLVRLPSVGSEDDEAELNELVARMRREIEILASIDSPYVARVLEPEMGVRECIIDDTTYAYYFEVLIDGESVAQVLANGVLPPAEVVRLGLNVTSAIGEFWSCDAVHRDVKPANVMRESASGRYVLLDAGYALDLTGPSLTRVAGIPGTLPYLAPERLDLARKRQLDFRSDLYSLGVVMYEAVVGSHPYIVAGMTQEAQLQAIANTAATQPSIIPQGLDRLWPVVLRLLEKRPHARYKSCQSLSDALAQCTQEAS